MATGPALSGVILAGGSSRRMGRDKAAMVLGGETLLARTVRVVASVADEVVVVGRSGFGEPVPGARFVEDAVPGRGPLSGLLTGLEQSSAPYSVVVACDLPFLSAEVLRYLTGLAPGYEAVVPRVSGRSQPLHAIYARGVRIAIERQIGRGLLKMEELLGELRVRWVEEDEIVLAALACRSFENVNTPEEWARARRTLSSGRGP